MSQSVSGSYSRRINIQRRLVYQILDDLKVVKIIRMRESKRGRIFTACCPNPDPPRIRSQRKCSLLHTIMWHSPVGCDMLLKRSG